MTGILIGHDGRAYSMEPTEKRTVFVAEMPGGRPASYAPHTGHAVLECWLRRTTDDGEDHAQVRLPSGRLMAVVACRVFDAEMIPARRILPAAHGARRAG